MNVAVVFFCLLPLNSTECFFFLFSFFKNLKSKLKHEEKNVIKVLQKCKINTEQPSSPCFEVFADCSPLIIVQDENSTDKVTQFADLPKGLIAVMKFRTFPRSPEGRQSPELPWKH